MARQKQQNESREDGLVNVISGLGMAGRDKSIASSFVFNSQLSQGELEDIYRSKGLGRKIVNLPVREMTREWFEVEGDVDDECVGYLETIHAKRSIQDALRWGDLYGGSLVVLGLDDRSTPDMPVNEKALNGVLFLNVYDRFQVTWTTADLYSDPMQPKFNQPQWYTVRPYGLATSIRVHETRTLKFIGAPVPPRNESENQGWGDSVLQAPYDELRNFCAAHAHSANLIEELVISVVTIKNLTQMLAAKGGEAKLKQRMEILDYGKAILRSMWLAEGETFDKKTASIAGVPEVIDRMAQALAAATEYGIPVSLLFGEQPSGLQATGESAQKNWYDAVKAAQEEKILPQLERLVRYAFLSKMGPTSGREPENWKVKFCPLFQLSEKEEADLRNMQMQTDKGYVEMGALFPEEVAINRFGGDRYSTETVIDLAQHQEPTPEERAAEEAAAQAAMQAAKAGANGGAADPNMPPAGNA